MIKENVELFFDWINERHWIYLKKAAGEPQPWTTDNILQTYKFTNAFRELDKTTVWMRKKFTNPHHNRPPEEIFFNCCFFRMFGTMEFAAAHGWVTEWDPESTKSLARAMLDRKQKVFTGAYIITNQGLRLPKEQVVVDYFLTPVWEARKDITETGLGSNSLQQIHKHLSMFVGWGGGGFMAYEVVTDLNHTIMPLAHDRMTWANAGPGAKRGLNRIHGRVLTDTPSKRDWNAEMYELLQRSNEYLEPHISMNEVDMRTIEHSLCEWDKYMRVKLGQGTPRSLYKASA